MARPAGQRRVVIKGATASPTFTTADARRLRVKERVATFTTRFAYAGYRNTNLARGAALLDDTLLEPGQTFSFNRAVGKPSVARGFVTGYVISGGGFTEDVDGGLSQLATTTYNAMFFAGLKDVEHEVHTVYSARFPKGRVATVDYGKSDLRFTNDSPYGVLITCARHAQQPVARGHGHGQHVVDEALGRHGADRQGLREEQAGDQAQHQGQLRSRGRLPGLQRPRHPRVPAPRPREGDAHREAHRRLRLLRHRGVRDAVTHGAA